MTVIAALALLLLIAFYLSAPNLRRRANPAPDCVYYAHRGLHDASAPENTLAAFGRAVEAGYGIELDVQHTADGHLVVFHDMTAERMCGVKKTLSSMTLAEVKALRVGSTSQRIPTFEEVLALVNGRVPLLVEIKLNPRQSQLTKHIAARLKNYRGPYLVESFVPFALFTLRRALPGALRGQLVSPFSLKDRTLPLMIQALLSGLFLNFLSRPDFIAYDKKMKKSLTIHTMRSLYRKKTAVWTLRTPQQLKTHKPHADLYIFENFNRRR